MAWIKGNRYLTTAQMRNNAILVYEELTSRGWTLNAICGILGNMQSESTINPGIWQNLDSSNTSGGFGLVQWTPSTNFTDWATDNGYAIDDGYAQLKWIDEQTIPRAQWIVTIDYLVSFDDFRKSTQSPEWCASCFLKNFERAGVEVEEQRRSQAAAWKVYIEDHLNSQTPPSQSKPKRKKFNFILFDRKRRMINDQS